MTRLEQGLDTLNLVLNDLQKQMSLDYLALMYKWNRVYNLTAIRKPEEMLVKHLFDSFSIYPYINYNTLLDVGTGAGLPGIPLAILEPERHVVLLDSNHKKTDFLVYVKAQLGLKNIHVVHSRIETYNAGIKIDACVCRAYSQLGKWISQTQTVFSAKPKWYAQKGHCEKEDIAALHAQGYVCDITKIQVPFLDEVRHLVTVTKA